MGWNYLSILKLQRYNRCSLITDKLFNTTLSWAFDYLFMMQLNLKSVSVQGVPDNKYYPRIKVSAADTLRNNVIMTSKRRRDVVLAS